MCESKSTTPPMKYSFEIQAKLKAVVEYEILPLLEHYWFDAPETAKKWADRLRQVFDG